jgi:NAD+ kinase
MARARHRTGEPVSTSPATVVVVAHLERPEAALVARRAVSWLEERGHRVLMPTDDAGAVGLDHVGGPVDEAAGIDVAISIGGDGTMLRTVALVSRFGVPVLGVNCGVLGYLSELEPEHLDEALDRYFGGRYDVEERMMVAASVTTAGQPMVTYEALNEIVIEKTASGHTVRLRLDIAGTPFTTYAADGLIVATPTGSTAYSLSARGPIVSPRHRALLVTPVSPHMLFDRTLVLAPDEDVTVHVTGHRSAVLAIDGRHMATLEEGDMVRCATATTVARLVQFGRRDFHQILKAKFGLSDR